MVPTVSGSLRWHDPDRFDGYDLSQNSRKTAEILAPQPFHRAHTPVEPALCHSAVPQPSLLLPLVGKKYNGAIPPRRPCYSRRDPDSATG